MRPSNEITNGDNLCLKGWFWKDAPGASKVSSNKRVEVQAEHFSKNLLMLSAFSQMGSWSKLEVTKSQGFRVPKLGRETLNLKPFCDFSFQGSIKPKLPSFRL